MSHGRPQEGAEDEEEGAGALTREEGLDRAAALARAAPSSTLPALAEAISQRQQQLQQCASTGDSFKQGVDPFNESSRQMVARSGAEPSVFLEQLRWLTHHGIRTLSHRALHPRESGYCASRLGP